MMYYEETKQSKRELILSYLSGIIFAIGWWLWIDSVAYKNSINDPVSVNFGHWVPGIIGTIGLIMVNSVSWTDLQGFGFGEDSTQNKARIWLFVSFTICFSGIIASIWIGVQHWFINKVDFPHSNWPGVAIILQNSFIFLSGILYRFAKNSAPVDPFSG